MPQLGDKERASAKNAADLFADVLVVSKKFWVSPPGSPEETQAWFRIKEVIEAGLIKLAENAP